MTTLQMADVTDAQLRELIPLVEPLMDRLESEQIARQLRVETRLVTLVRLRIKQDRQSAEHIRVDRLYEPDEARHVIPNRLMAWPAPQPGETA